jgi:hypothetical protein
MGGLFGRTETRRKGFAIQESERIKREQAVNRESYLISRKNPFFAFPV